MSIVPGGEGGSGRGRGANLVFLALTALFFGFRLFWLLNPLVFQSFEPLRCGRVPGWWWTSSRKTKQKAPSVAPCPILSLEGGSLWWQRGHFNLHLVCHREGKDGDKHSRVDTKSTLSCSQLEVNVASYLLGYYYCFLHTTSPAFQGNPIHCGPSFSWQSSLSCSYHQNDRTRQRLQKGH